MNHPGRAENLAVIGSGKLVVAIGMVDQAGRRLLPLDGHEVKLIEPQLVKPYVKRRKNDTADAEAVCEAMAQAGDFQKPVCLTRLWIHFHCCGMEMADGRAAWAFRYRRASEGSLRHGR